MLTRTMRIGILAAATVSGSAAGQITSLLDWATVGDVGNPPVPEWIAPNWHNNGWTDVGTVNHAYRITTTEVTAEVWIDFVRAWAPYHSDYFGFGQGSIDLRGGGIRFDSRTREYSLIPGGERNPTKVQWRLAAIFANWLHNDMGTDEASFLSGAYDTSTFGGSGSFLTDQFEPSPGAKYWLPTLDEWIKAMHYDPNRFGPEEGGYWLFPHGSDEPPIPGPPGIGQTDDGWGGLGSRAVGLYSDVMSPYGLLDGSGGAPEYAPNPRSTANRIRMSQSGGFGGWDSHLYYGWGSTTIGSPNGFRIVSRIPTPGSLAVLSFVLVYTARRNTRKVCT